MRSLTIDRSEDQGSVTIANLRAAQAELANLVGADPQYDDHLNRSEAKTSGQLSGQELTALKSLAAAGHRVELRIEKAAWNATIASTAGGALQLETSGPPDEAFDDDAAVAAATEAINQRSADRLIELAAGLHFTLNVTLINDPQRSGFHWCRTRAILLKEFQSPDWYGVAARLCNPSAPARVIVQDGQGEIVRTANFVVHGPDVSPTAVRATDSDFASAFRSARLTGSRAEAPPPTDLVPLAKTSNDVGPLLNSMARQMSWLWIATSVEFTASGPRAEFDGARVVAVVLSVQPEPDPPSDEIALWEWAIATTDPAAELALLQAVTLAVAGDGDLASAARPALRTAKSLYQLARNGVITEALAARRGAREGGIDAGRGASIAAGDASAKTVDRVVVQLVALGALFFAQKANLLNADVARNLVVLAAVVVVLLGLTVFIVDYPRISATIDSFLKDLEQYKDALSEDDIAAIKGLDSIDGAKRALRTARLASGVVIAAALLASAVVYFQIPSASGSAVPTPQATPTQSVASSPTPVTFGPPPPSGP